jgi:hypothetical protein
MLSQHWSMTIGARRIALPVSAPVISASATVQCRFKRCEQEWFVCFCWWHRRVADACRHLFYRGQSPFEHFSSDESCIATSEQTLLEWFA